MTYGLLRYFLYYDFTSPFSAFRLASISVIYKKPVKQNINEIQLRGEGETLFSFTMLIIRLCALPFSSIHFIPDLKK